MSRWVLGGLIVVGFGIVTGGLIALAAVLASASEMADRHDEEADKWH